MHGLDLTYQWLQRTDNQAAIAVLAEGLQSKSQTTRARSVATLVSRDEPEAADLVLRHWSSLTADEHRALSGRTDRVGDAAERYFSSGENLPSAIAACRALRLFSQVDHLATLAETADDVDIRRAATSTLLKLSMPLGQAARQDRPISTTRGPFLARLVQSIRCFREHRNEHLVDAFLITSTWADSALRTWVAADDPTGKLIQHRLQQSQSPGVLHLLAGYLQRRMLPKCVAKALADRREDILGEAILRSIGPAPPSVTRRHLGTIGTPASLTGGIQRCEDVTPANRAAMVHVYAACGQSAEEILPVTLYAITNWQQPDVVSAVSLAMSRCPIPNVDWSMRAAVSVARLLDEDAKRNGPPAGDTLPTLQSLGSDDLADPASVMIAQLIDLLAHQDPGVAKGARRLLTPLHAESMLSRFDDLRVRSRRRLGRVVMRIDPDAVARVRDTLRHPVLEKRIEAIACADALAAVELLSDSFVHIAKEDHQEARIRAAEAMGSATDEVTYELLQELLLLPESQVRDAAEAALATRRQSDAKRPARASQ